MASRDSLLFPWSKSLLLNARKSSDAADQTLQIALDLFVLGRPTLANQLIDAFYKHYRGIDFDVVKSDTARCLYHAWKATNSMPSYISQPDRNLVINGPASDDEPAREKWASIEENRFDGLALPDHLEERTPEGNLKPEAVDWAIESLMTAEESPSNVAFSIGEVVQIAILAGQGDVAAELIVKHVPQLYSHLAEIWDSMDASRGEQRQWLRDHLGLHHEPQIWKIFNSDISRNSFNINEDTLLEYVNQTCQIIEQRFTQGPHRPYTSQTTPQLVRMLDENYLAARKANPEAGEHLSILHHGLPTTFLSPGATPEQLTHLATRLSHTPVGSGCTPSKPMLPDGHLPEDYTTFLRTTNGIQTEPKDPSGLFASIDEVGDDGRPFPYDMNWTLFPYQYTSFEGIDNISLGDYSCFSIGMGGDEGQNILIPPSSVKPVLERFEGVYVRASEAQKRVYERAAVDVYGGLDRLRRVEWLCGVWYHWDPEQQIWGSFREYLEECVREAVERRGEDEREAEAERMLREGEEKEGEGLSGKDEGGDVDMGEEEEGNTQDDLRDAKSLRVD